MADDPNDPNPALRAELLAALAVLAPQIRGLDDLLKLPMSDALRAAVGAQDSVRKRRRDLIVAVLSSLDRVREARVILEGDGYPDLPVDLIPLALLQELGVEVSDVEAAVAVFAQDRATTINVSLGEATQKPSTI